MAQDGELEVDSKVEMIRALVPLGLMHVHELLDDEVKALAGERYARKGELERGRRHGTNPGTVDGAVSSHPVSAKGILAILGVRIEFWPCAWLGKCSENSEKP